MPIVVVGIIGGIVGGGGLIIGAASHEDHSDYSDYRSYSDYAERERIEREAKNRAEKDRIKQDKIELDDEIARKTTKFKSQNQVDFEHEVSSKSCGFESFREDMRPMDEAAEEAIRQQVATDLKEKIAEDKKTLKEIDKLIIAINEKVLK